MHWSGTDPGIQAQLPEVHVINECNITMIRHSGFLQFGALDLVLRPRAKR
jgi:hypothetical protein